MFIKTKQKSLLTLDAGTSASLQKLRIFPSKRKKKKNPGESDRSRLERIRQKETVATWCSLCQQLLPHTQQPRVRVSVRQAKCSRDTRCTASRAHKGRAKHGVEWLRLQQLASSGAHRPLPLCILGNAHRGALVCGHMLEEARGYWRWRGRRRPTHRLIILFYLNKSVVSPQTHNHPRLLSVF